MAPSMASQFQSNPLSESYASNPRRQNSWKTPSCVHSRNRRCADELEQIPVPFSAFQGHPVRSTNTMAFMASRSGTRGL
jgi:hypothetical protein